jgi:hypothetical protein
MTGAIAQDRESCQFLFCLTKIPPLYRSARPGSGWEGRLWRLRTEDQRVASNGVNPNIDRLVVERTKNAWWGNIAGRKGGRQIPLLRLLGVWRRLGYLLHTADRPISAPKRIVPTLGLFWGLAASICQNHCSNLASRSPNDRYRLDFDRQIPTLRCHTFCRKPTSMCKLRLHRRCEPVLAEIDARRL